MPKKKTIDYEKLAQSKLENWLEKSKTLEVLVRDLENYRNNPSINYNYFVKKYDERDRKGNFKSIESLNGTIRRTYNYLKKAKLPKQQISGIQIRQTYIKSKKYGSIWNNTIAKIYKPKFKTEKYHNLPFKGFGIVGFYKAIRKVKVERFVLLNANYIMDGINIIRDIGKYFNAIFANNGYTKEDFEPLVIRVRVFLRERYSNEEKFFSSGFLDVGTYISEFNKIFKKYYTQALLQQAKYEDRVVRWYVRYISFETRLFDINNFRKEIGLKKSFYANFI